MIRSSAGSTHRGLTCIRALVYIHGGALALPIRPEVIVKYLLLTAFVGLLAGCHYFGYQESCTDNPNRPDCDGTHAVEHRR